MLGKPGRLFHICSPQLPWPTAATQQGWGRNPQPAAPWAVEHSCNGPTPAQGNEAQLCPSCSAKGESEVTFSYCEMKPKQRRWRAPESRAQPLMNSLTMKQNRNIPTLRWENLKANQAQRDRARGDQRRAEQPQHSWPWQLPPPPWGSVSPSTALMMCYSISEWEHCFNPAFLCLPLCPQWVIEGWLNDSEGAAEAEEHLPWLQLSLPPLGLSPSGGGADKCSGMFRKGIINCPFQKALINLVMSQYRGLN